MVINIKGLTLNKIIDGLKNGTFTSYELIKAYRQSYEDDLKQDKPINAFIEFFTEAEEKAKQADILRSQGDRRDFLGVPIAIKDNILIKGKEASCASHVLKGFVSPYNSTVIERLEEQGVIFLGRLNMDEFAMGSSNEYTIYGPVRNPKNLEYSAGGSSGGSAAVVASFQAPLSLGTDTGGSVRLPACFTGICGYKPSYGMISRYGIVAYASSLDQVGILAHEPQDIASFMKIVKGKDSKDMTSRNYNVSFDLLNEEVLEGLKVAVLSEFEHEAMENSVRGGLQRVKGYLQEKGAKVVEESLPVIEDSLALYYVVSLCEAASNLNRYDSIRYGSRDEKIKDLESLYLQFRSKNFGEEVHRRIISGNYFLASYQHEERFYDQAIVVLDHLKLGLKKLFESYDVILTPTSFTTAFKLAEKNKDPIQMYLSDLCTIFANLAGLPAISVPSHVESDKGLPTGVQFISSQGKDDLILSLAQVWNERRKTL